MQTNPPLYDVIVIGGGIIGISTADELARRGQRVLLLDQFEPGHSHGSSHGDGRIIRFAYPEPIYLELALQAYEAWDELERRADQRFFQVTGGWDCGPADSPELAELEENLRRYQLPYERLTADESNRRFPQLHLEAGSEAIYQADSGVLFATPAVLALWRLAGEAGVVARTGERVEAVEEQGELLRVRSRSGAAWLGRRLVVAAGGWSRRLLAGIGLDLPLEATQEQFAFFAPADKLDHRAGALPWIIDYHTKPPFYALPQIEVPGVKAGWHHSGSPIDPDVPIPLSEENLAAVQEWIGRRFPHLDRTPFLPQRCLYTNTPDYHFVLDRHPGLPQVVLGAGFSGHGFKFGPVVGRILADLALDGQSAVDLTTFAISRFERVESLSRRRGA